MNPGSFANAQDDVLQAFSNIAFNIELALINRSLMGIMSWAIVHDKKKVKQKQCPR
jgi:hypothetical protein